MRMRPTDAAARVRVVAAMDALGGALLSEGLIGRSAMDDYVPEVSRYGGADNLALAERLFSASSDQVAAFLASRPSEEQRLYQAAADAVHWCSVLFDSPDEQRAFLRLCQGGLSLTVTKKGNPLGKFHRAHDRALREHLAAAPGDERVAKSLAALSSSVRQELDGHRDGSVFGSALHLHCNRLFAFDAVRLEYLAYELAQRRIHQLHALEGAGGQA
ncbi:thiopeptide-type bacteriocin biosynthesis protein [Nocardiopsis rhodophaea]|uniref:thiopeptide-type bacteriocin biosynthesis protein n=1 Tax=Nocardiopsis rhodophaea TaxID=280238 RepID=UPI0031E0415F